MTIPLMLRNWGREAKKEGIYIYTVCVCVCVCVYMYTYGYLWLIHIVVLQKPAQHCKALILQSDEAIILQLK